MGRVYNTRVQSGSRRRKRKQTGRKVWFSVLGTLCVALLALGGVRWWSTRRDSIVGSTHPLTRRFANNVPKHTITTSPADSAVRHTSTAPSSTESKTVSSGATTSGSHDTLPPSAMLSVPAQDQNPQLPNGCEVTSLSMLLASVGHPVSKMALAMEQPYDPTPRVKNAKGQTIRWGNPNVGFVGSPYVWADGFGIFHGPITRLLNKVLPGQAVDLTDKPFNTILSYVSRGRAVMVWTTATLKPTNAFPASWETPEGPFHSTYEEHAVLVVGYDNSHIYINNPLTGAKGQEVNRAGFIAAWHELGNQAVTVRLSSVAHHQ